MAAARAGGGELSVPCPFLLSNTAATFLTGMACRVLSSLKVGFPTRQTSVRRCGRDSFASEATLGLCLRRAGTGGGQSSACRAP